MYKKNGFTLLELLITATLLSILAVFAMGSYRTSMFQARLEDYKNRTRAAAYAVQRYMVEDGGNPHDFPNPAETVDWMIENTSKLDRFFDKKYQNQDYSPEGWKINLCWWKDESGEESISVDCKKAKGTASLACLQWKSDESAPENFKKTGRDAVVFCVSETDEEQFIFLGDNP